LWVGAVQYLPPPVARLHLAWWVLAPVFFAAERWSVTVPLRRSSPTLSVTEAPLVIGLFFASSPLDLLVAFMVCAGVAKLLRRKPSLLRAAFNLAHHSLFLGLSLLIFHAFHGDNGQLDWHSWLAAYCAA